MAVYKTATKIHRQPYNEESCYHYNILCIALLKKKGSKTWFIYVVYFECSQVDTPCAYKSHPLEKFCSGRQWVREGFIEAERKIALPLIFNAIP